METSDIYPPTSPPAYNPNFADTVEIQHSEEKQPDPIIDETIEHEHDNDNS